MSAFSVKIKRLLQSEVFSKGELLLKKVTDILSLRINRIFLFETDVVVSLSWSFQSLICYGDFRVNKVAVNLFFMKPLYIADTGKEIY